jgi:hypothetical protein
LGAEHGMMQRAWLYATSRSPTIDGPPLPRPRPEPDRKDSPNQRLLRRLIWLLEALILKNKAGWDDALDRTLFVTDLILQWGHMRDDPDDGRNEVFTASHRQLWYAAYAGLLWALQWADEMEWSDERTSKLREACLLFWQVETAVANACHYIDNTRGRGKGTERRTVLVAGARDGKLDDPMVTNATCDSVVFALIDDSWTERNPRTPRQGNYSAAIPLMKRAVAAGLDTETLVGDKRTLLTATREGGSLHRVGWRMLGNGWPGDYYTLFDNLGFVYDGCDGAGRIGGATVLHWKAEDAAAFAQSCGLEQTVPRLEVVT